MIRRGFSNLVLILIVAGVGVIIALVLGLVDLANFGKQVRLTGPAIKEEIDSQVESLRAVGTSDKVGDIEKDLTETNLETTDSELTEVDRELEESF